MTRLTPLAWLKMAPLRRKQPNHTKRACYGAKAEYLFNFGITPGHLRGPHHAVSAASGCMVKRTTQLYSLSPPDTPSSKHILNAPPPTMDRPDIVYQTTPFAANSATVTVNMHKFSVLTRVQLPWRPVPSARAASGHFHGGEMSASCWWERWSENRHRPLKYCDTREAIGFSILVSLLLVVYHSKRAIHTSLPPYVLQ